MVPLYRRLFVLTPRMLAGPNMSLQLLSASGVLFSLVPRTSLAVNEKLPLTPTRCPSADRQQFFHRVRAAANAQAERGRGLGHGRTPSG